MAHADTDLHLHANTPCSPQDVEAFLEQAETLAIRKGQRLTKIRRKVLRLLLESAEPSKAYDLLANLDGEGSAKPPTVYRALDFLPPVETGAFGPVYEFRTYRAKINGLHELVAKWRDAVPGREEFSKLSVAMYGLDGEPRLTQIWPYASLEARSEARAHSVAEGKWPPKDGPASLMPEMTSQIAMPLPFSPMT